MKEETIIQQRDIKFLSKITASCTHEIRNALAIISELSGLIEDELRFGQGDNPFSKKELASFADTLKEQTGRANQILLKLNLFAHSAEETGLTSLDLGTMINNIVFFSNRMAGLKRITLKTAFSPEPLSLKSYPFKLQHAIFLCIQKAIELSVMRGQVTITFNKLTNGAEISVIVDSATGQANSEAIQKLSLPSELAVLCSKVSISYLQNNSLIINLTVPFSPE
jgi:signal transduction histidine kinase